MRESDINTNFRVALWYSLLLASTVLGVWLSLNYGALGLVGFLALNIILRLFCPDSLLQTSEKYPESHVAMFAFLVALFSPLFFILIIWLFVQPEDVARWVVNNAHFGIIHDSTKEMADYILDPASSEFSRKIKTEINHETTWVLGVTLWRIVFYLILPIFIAVDCVQNSRAIKVILDRDEARGFTYYEKIHGHKGVLSFTSIIVGSCALAWGLDWIGSNPHIYLSHGSSFLTLIGTILFTGIGLLWPLPFIVVRRFVFKLWAAKIESKY